MPAEQLDAQKSRLEKEIEQFEKLVVSSRGQLANEAFLSRAPEKVVSQLREKLAGYESQLEKSRNALAALES